MLQNKLFRKKRGIWSIYSFVNYEPEMLALSLVVQGRKLAWFSIWRHQLQVLWLCTEINALYFHIVSV